MKFLTRALAPFAPVWQWLGRYHLDKLLITGGSMAIFIWTFALFCGFWLSALITFLLFIHEMGHVVAFRWKGIQTSAPIFIPFLGAVVLARQQLKDADEEAFIGYGGPLFGSLAAFITFGIWWAMPSRPVVLLLGSILTIFLNLYNMCPIPPLDGGRVVRGIAGWFKYLGLVFIVAFALALQSPIIVLLTMLVLLMGVRGGGMKAKHRLIFGIFLELLAAAMLAPGIGYGWPLVATVPLLLAATLLNAFILRGYLRERAKRLFTVSLLEYSEKLDPDTRRKLIQSLDDESSEPAPLSRAQKVKWVMLYAGLLIALMSFMFWEFLALQKLINS
ncbi:MAG: hypothetical protein Q8L24_02900 [bacterium]|nr:hypothetical protein [bacterium]